jgi:ParB-like chromosome segregation protein Spo0J
MEFHSAAAMFPFLEGRDFEEFKADIARHGLKEPIVLLGGKILDGRNRYRAILEIEDEAIQPEFLEYTGDQAPEDFVRSKNLYRRHLTASQRAMNAARARPAFEEEAKQAMSEGGTKGKRGKSKNKGASKDAPLSPRKASDRGRASMAAGKAAKVSPASVDRARTVLEHGADELIEMVDQGSVSVAAAAKLAAKRSGTQQKALVEKGPKAVREAVAKTQNKGKPRKSKDSRDALTVAEGILNDLEKLIGYVKKSDKGTPSVRDNVIVNMRLAKKYVSASRKLFS